MRLRLITVLAALLVAAPAQAAVRGLGSWDPVAQRMVREAGVSLGVAASGVGGLLIAGECAQRYLPGRIAESTDPILAVIAACVIVWLKDRPPTPARLPARHAREHDRHDNRRD